MAATPVETFGEPIALPDPGRTLYPLTLRRYAVDKCRLTHLAKHLGVLPDIEDTEPKTPSRNRGQSTHLVSRGYLETWANGRDAGTQGRSSSICSLAFIE